MVEAYTDAIDCECFLTGDVCVCEEGCECGCPECVCQDWEEVQKLMTGGCGCGGNCMCNQSIDEENEGGLE